MTDLQGTTLLVFISACVDGSALHGWADQILELLKADMSYDTATRSTFLYKSEEESVLFYFSTNTAEFSFLKVKLDEMVSHTATTWRIYEELALQPSDLSQPHPASPMPPHILVINAMTPSPENEADFNDWYAQEHIPMLSRAPGWIYSRRFRLFASSDAAPQYLALHAWEDDLSFTSTPYKEAVSTPWRMRVVDSVIAKERRVVTFVQEM